MVVGQLPQCFRRARAAGRLRGSLAGTGLLQPLGRPPLLCQGYRFGKGHKSWPSVSSLLGTILLSSGTSQRAERRGQPY